MKAIVKATGGLLALLSVTGCMNMPTETAKIQGSHVSAFKYEPYDCRRLQGERETLMQRESMLAAAQQQRIATSQAQAFWHGFGQGDGIEAYELANVRGELAAINNTLATKSCGS